jgi:hypothetical protein
MPASPSLALTSAIGNIYRLHPNTHLLSRALSFSPGGHSLRCQPRLALSHAHIFNTHLQRLALASQHLSRMLTSQHPLSLVFQGPVQSGFLPFFRGNRTETGLTFPTVFGQPDQNRLRPVTT